MSGPDVTRLVMGLKAEREAREARLKDLVNDLLAKPSPPLVPQPPAAPPAPDPSEALRAEIQKLQAEKKELLARPDPSEALRAEVARLRAEKEEMSRKNTALYEELQAKGPAGQQARLERELADERRRAEKAGEGMLKVQAESAAFREEVRVREAAAAERAAGLERQLQEGREAVAREVAQAAPLREQARQAQAEAEALKGRLKEAESRAEGLEKSLIESRESAAAQEPSVPDERIGNLERQLQDSREALAREQVVSVRLREQLSEAQDKVEPMQRRLRESEMRLAAASASSAEKARTAELEKALAESREALDREVAQAASLRDQARQAVAEAETLRERLKGAEAAAPAPQPGGSPLEAKLLEVVQQVQSSRKDWLDGVLKELSKR